MTNIMAEPQAFESKLQSGEGKGCKGTGDHIAQHTHDRDQHGVAEKTAEGDALQTFPAINIVLQREAGWEKTTAGENQMVRFKRTENNHSTGYNISRPKSIMAACLPA